MAYLLGIDVGTSSAKALVTDEIGRRISCGRAFYDIQIPQPGFAEQNGEALWGAVCDAIRAAIATAGVKENIIAIGVTGQMHGMLLLDADYRPLRPIVIWADRRSAAQVRQLKNKGIEDKVGNPVSTGLFLPSLLWVKENEPEIYKRTCHVMLPKDYVRFRMCGLNATDYSDATGTLLFNLKKGTWDWEIMEQLDLDSRWFPEFYHSCEIAGETTLQCSMDTGLSAGIKIVYGGGDTPMQLAGNGVVTPGQLNTNIGTASQINCICSDLPKTDLRINLFHHISQKSWIAAGASLNGGIVMKWLQNNVLSGFSSFSDMSKAAATSKAGANGVIMLPFLNGERAPYMDEYAKAILFGMTLSNDQNDIIRAAMESVVFSFRDCISVFQEMGLPMQEEIVASGGGAKSPIWLQIQADILQKTIKVTKEDEDASKGAVLAAGVGCGIYKSMEEAKTATIQWSDRIYEPNEKNRLVYDESFAVYQKLYRQNKALFKTLTTETNAGKFKQNQV